MAKVVYNACFGGFTFSQAALAVLKEKGLPVEVFCDGSLWLSDAHAKRHDPRLVDAVETMGNEASGACAELRIAEVRDRYSIVENDGAETVEQPEDIEWISVTS